MDQQAALGIVFVILGAACIGIIVGILIAVFFCLTIYRALGKVEPRRRTMEPGLAFLNLVPLVALYWSFHTAINVAQSLRNEFTARRMDDGGDYGRTIGLTWAIMGVVSALAGLPLNFVNIAMGPERQMGQQMNWFVMALTGIVVVVSLASFVCMIIYWTRIAGYSRRLAEDDLRDDHRDDDRYDDEDNDVAPPRPVTGPKTTDIQSKPRRDEFTE